MKAMITYIGGEGDAGQKENVWGKYTFPINKAVEVTDRNMIEKARTNRFFKVTGETRDPGEGTTFVVTPEDGVSRPHVAPADPFDHDENGKPGGSKAAAKR